LGSEEAATGVDGVLEGEVEEGEADEGFWAILSEA
jgi:hypothetical protein